MGSAEDNIVEALDYIGRREKHSPSCPRCVRRKAVANGLCRQCRNDVARQEEEAAERIRASKRRYERRRRAGLT